MSDDRLFQDQKKHRPCSADQCRSPALMCLAGLYLTKWNQNVMRRKQSQIKTTSQVQYGVINHPFWFLYSIKLLFIFSVTLQYLSKAIFAGSIPSNATYTCFMAPIHNLLSYLPTPNLLYNSKRKSSNSIIISSSNSSILMIINMII